MQDTVQISEFGKILVFLVLGVLFILAGYGVNSLLSKKKPNSIKNATYECGEETVGNSWVQFNMRFYVIALLFLIFDVEIVFLFPWATVYAAPQFLANIPHWGILSLSEMFVFISLLLLGLLYVWRKGDLNWLSSKQQIASINTPIPLANYLALNSKKYLVKAFVVNEEMPAMTASTASAGNVTAAPTTIRRAPIKTIVKKSE
jgi:NADH-quinone oxidoreductase subunit A